MASPTRFPSGVTNVRSTSPTGMLMQPDPSVAHTFWEDFDFFLATDWTSTLVGSSTIALTAGDGGLVLQTTGATSGNSIFTQKIADSFTFETGKPMWFKWRGKVSTLTTTMQVGIIVTDTTPLDATDGIYFLSTTTTGVVTGIVRRNATTGSTSVAFGQLIADTFTELAWFWDGKDTVVFYQDGVAKGQVTGVAASYLPDTTGTVSYGVQTDSANARTMTTDYILAVKDR